jgi:hypothetical protein
MTNDKQASEKLVRRIRFVMDFCENYNNQSTILTSNPRAIIIQAALQEISDDIAKAIDLKNFVASHSKGSGSFPRVPWIGISNLGKKVSNSLSVVTCFARDGRGIVCGLMSPVEFSVKARVVIRSTQKEFLNIDGISSITRYNDKFINPVEFMRSGFSTEKYIQHINKSIELMSEFKK